MTTQSLPYAGIQGADESEVKTDDDNEEVVEIKRLFFSVYSTVLEPINQIFFYQTKSGKSI